MIGGLLGFWIGWRYGLRVVVVAFIAILLAALVLAPFSKPHSSPQILPSQIVPGVCGYGSHPVLVASEDDSGPYPLYEVECSNGLQVLTAETR